MVGERKVCIAVGPSREAQAALHWANQKLLKKEDNVVLLHVVSATPKSEGVSASTEFGVPATEAVKKVAEPAELKASEEVLRKCLAAVTKEAGIPENKVKAQPKVAVVTGTNDVGRTLVEEAEKCGCDSLVIGSRGLGMSRKALTSFLGLGSVSDYVVRHANVTVIVHKEQPAAAASPLEK